MYIKERTQATFKALLAKANLYSRATVEPKIRASDIWLVSYPKSGNTYLRFLVASALAEKQINFFEIDRYVPDIYQVRKTFLERMVSPRIMKSHELARKDYATVLYLVRDPRDVVLSYAYWGYRSSSDEDVENQMDSLVLDWMERVDGFWSWDEHLSGWFSLIDHPCGNQKIKWIRYEDLVEETEQNLISILDFIEFEAKREVVTEAIRNSTKEKMRHGERAAKPFFASKRRAFVRGGRRRNFDELVSSKTKERFFDRYGPWMERFGYHW